MRVSRTIKHLVLNAVLFTFVGGFRSFVSGLYDRLAVGYRSLTVSMSLTS